MGTELRAADEIQAAHDRFTAILLNDVPNPFPNVPQEVLTATVDVLCWVLKHQHNRTFAVNLKAMDVFFASRGLVLQDSWYHRDT